MKDIPTIHNDYARVELTPGFGFSLIPEQIRDASMRDGFTFNLLVVGRRGLGSTTLINSLFASSLIKRERPDSITTTANEIVENNIRLAISVTTYHGEDFGKIFRLIESLNKEYYEKEQGLSTAFRDTRLHAALYLVPGDKISKSEIDGLKELSEKVNLIPIITKADMFTIDELEQHRAKINKTFQENAIRFYDYAEANQARFPMATIASETRFEEDGTSVLGRNYPWGFIDIENEFYSDFKKLQRVLIGECFVNLVYETDTVFYNKFRQSLMASEGNTDSKARLARLVSQMESAIEERYTAKIRALEGAGMSLASELSEQLSLTSNAQCVQE